MDIEGFSCYKKDQYNLEGQEKCNPYPDDPESQKVLRIFYLGFEKELLWEEDFKSTVDMIEKETYEKDEIIKFIKVNVTEQEQAKALGLNLCSYNQALSFANRSNITDKNKCFNTEKFDELNGISECGYATIKYFKKGVLNYTINTCNFIFEENLPETFLKFVKKSIYDSLLEIYPYADDLDEEIEYKKKILNKLVQRRKLQSNENTDISYELVIEDKNGRILKYTSEADDPEVIQQGSKTNNVPNSESDNNSDAKNETDDNSDEPTKIRSNSSLYNILNIILTLSLILLTV